MDEIDRAVQVLRARVETVEKELADLKAQLVQAEKLAQDGAKINNTNSEIWKWPLEPNDYERYGRQMILPGFGVDGESIPRINGPLIS